MAESGKEPSGDKYIKQIKVSSSIIVLTVALALTMSQERSRLRTDYKAAVVASQNPKSIDVETLRHLAMVWDLPVDPANLIVTRLGTKIQEEKVTLPVLNTTMPCQTAMTLVFWLSVIESASLYAAIHGLRGCLGNIPGELFMLTERPTRSRTLDLVVLWILRLGYFLFLATCFWAPVGIGYFTAASGSVTWPWLLPAVAFAIPASLGSRDLLGLALTKAEDLKRNPSVAST